MTLEARVNEVEAKAVFAEDLLDALNRTVYHQQTQIERLQRELRELREQMAAGLPGESRSLREEIPPHY